MIAKSERAEGIEILLIKSQPVHYPAFSDNPQSHEQLTKVLRAHKTRGKCLKRSRCLATYSHTPTHWVYGQGGERRIQRDAGRDN